MRLRETAKKVSFKGRNIQKKTPTKNVTTKHECRALVVGPLKKITFFAASLILFYTLYYSFTGLIQKSLMHILTWCNTYRCNLQNLVLGQDFLDM